MLDRTINFFLVHAAIAVPLVVVLALFVSSTARAACKMAARIVSRLLLIAVVVALVYDGTRTLAGGSGLVMTSLWDHWTSISPATLEATRKFVSIRLHPAVWDSGLVPLLHWPAWLLAAMLALILSIMGRRRREISVFVN
ncbi:MAG: hypothetical protein AB7E81_13245 [Hyphomicrobiaceae bacterium]